MVVSPCFSHHIGTHQVRSADRPGRFSKIADYLRRESFDVSAEMNFGLSKKLASLIRLDRNRLYRDPSARALEGADSTLYPVGNHSYSGPTAHSRCSS